eukprot:TRINITY_DN9420_c0_g1_i2.p2 TRINITY_DN9420_c0_g1~~TRINITY_DN9420_c0_g1_i2.p2  ORF type:complete len:311 (+),score=127.07 TRINITY_DN9420_c0_g1_i2:758-1690(+)
MRCPRIVFSDLDGTLVQFEAHFRPHGRIEHRPGDPPLTAWYVDNGGQERRCRVLPTSSIGCGLFSERSAELIRRLRCHSVAFVYVTGARKSTLLARLPFMPVADLAICETGGRLYGTDGALDREWTELIERQSGPLDTALPPKERAGDLWKWYRLLADGGFAVDARSYTCCFRVSTKKAGTQEKLLQLVRERMPPTLAFAQNLGNYDFFPAQSGKGNVARYVMRKRGIAAADAAALFDDDNDLPMAAAVGQPMVTQATHGMVRDAVRKNPHWVVAKGHGPIAAEELLEQLLVAAGGTPPPTDWIDGQSRL